MLNAGSAALADIDPALLEAVEACLPSGRHIDGDLGIAALSTWLTAHRLATTQTRRLSRAPSRPCEPPGQRLDASQQAVDLYGELTRLNLSFPPYPGHLA